MSNLIDRFSPEELKEVVAECSSFNELAKKLGYTTLGNNRFPIQNHLAELGISTEHFTHLSKFKVVRTEENIFCENSSACQRTLREGYVKGNYTPYKCAICGQEPIGQGKELSLTLDHINGNNRDNRFENLRGVCPNCDRQLDTFGSKNTQNKHKYYKKAMKDAKGEFKPAQMLQQIDPQTGKVVATFNSIGAAVEATGCPYIYRASNSKTKETSLAGGYIGKRI